MAEPAPSAIAQLKTATWPLHQRLERRLDFRTRTASRENYRDHLRQLWGFYATLEPRLCGGVLDEWLEDYGERRKLPMIEQDLEALGIPSAALAQLPRCPTVPPCEDAASAFGCAYVIEGATLGGRSLLPAIGARLGLTSGQGAAFLASYGDAVTLRWKTFGTALNQCCADAARRARATAAAVATFSAFESWLCGAPA